MKITATLTDSYKVDTQIDNHSYTLDRTAAFGGTDAGSSPVELMMTSLLGCKIMVAKGFLDTRDFKFEKIEADIEYESGGTNLYPTLEGTVTIKIIGGDLDEKSQTQIHRIIDTGCPVANLLDPEKATIQTKTEFN